ncbi:hypothetical protein Tco_1188477 [Tanacetum coccineum]
MDDVVESKDFSFPKEEESIVRQWNETKAFETPTTPGNENPAGQGTRQSGKVLLQETQNIINEYEGRDKKVKPKNGVVVLKYLDHGTNGKFVHGAVASFNFSLRLQGKASRQFPRQSGKVLLQETRRNITNGYEGGDKKVKPKNGVVVLKYLDHGTNGSCSGAASRY